MSTDTPADQSRWAPVTTVEELSAAGKVVAQVDDTEVLLVWKDGAPCALANVCIHRGRSLAQGFILGDRIVCPGHQWAFDVSTGFCKERDQYQPVYPTRVDGDKVEVDLGRPDQE